MRTPRNHHWGQHMSRFANHAGPVRDVSRRDLLRISAGAFAALSGGARAFLKIGKADAAGVKPMLVQYDWLIGNGQIGDIVAKEKGFFADEGLDVTLRGGGPNAQTLPPLLAGQAQLGRMTSAQALVANGAGRPVMFFACGYQYSPYAYISLPRSPIRTPQDLVGKTIAVNPNGRFTLQLILNLHGIDPDSVKVITQSADMTALLVGQADAVTGFLTNTSALAAIGKDRIVMTAESGGVVGYANAYLCTQDAFKTEQDAFAKFVRACAKGWGAFENRKDAVDIMCDAYPNLDRAVEHATVDTVMEIAFGPETKANGWGWFNREKLQKQIDIFASGKAFAVSTPVLDEVSSQAVLKATADARPRLG
jgi:NitT/TauT family transport system substrate-binding protein